MITMSPGRSSCGQGGRLEPPGSPCRALAVDREHLVGIAGDRHRTKGGIFRRKMPVSAPAGLGMKLQQLGRFDFTSHGESPDGPDTSTVYTNPSAVCTFKTDRPGTILASSYCNIHGLWESSKPLAIA
jgi:hypothetical protein